MGSDYFLNFFKINSTAYTIIEWMGSIKHETRENGFISTKQREFYIDEKRKKIIDKFKIYS